MEGALREDVIASEEVGWVGKAWADDIVIGCGTEAGGVLLKEPVAGDDLGADRVNVPATFAIFAGNAGVDGGGIAKILPRLKLVPLPSDHVISWAFPFFPYPLEKPS